MIEPIILKIPEAISERARAIAKTTEQPAEQVLLAHLQTLSPPLPALPPDEQAELDALKHLSDDALWTIAREQMPEDVQRRAHDLMDKNSRGKISPEEYSELEKLVERSDRLMLRKSEAAALLRERGRTFRQSDFGSQHE